MGKVYSCAPPNVDHMVVLANNRGKSLAPDLAGHRVAPCFACFTRVTLSAVSRAYNDWRRGSQHLAIDASEYEVLVRQICPDISLRQIFLQIEISRSRTGMISCLDFLGGVALLCRDTLKSKLKLIFRMYDFGVDNVLSQPELVLLVSSCLRGFCTMKHAPVATLKGIVELATEACAQRASHHNGMTFGDFYGWCKEEGAMLFLLEGLDSSLEKRAEALAGNHNQQRILLVKLANVEAKLHSITWKPTTIDDYWFGGNSDEANKEKKQITHADGVTLVDGEQAISHAVAPADLEALSSFVGGNEIGMFASVSKLCGTLFTQYDTILSNVNATPSGPMQLDWLSILRDSKNRGSQRRVGVSVDWLDQLCDLTQQACPAMKSRKTTIAFWQLAQRHVTCLANYYDYELDADLKRQSSVKFEGGTQVAAGWGTPDTVHECDIISFAQWICEVDSLMHIDARVELKLEYALVWADVIVRWMLCEEWGRWQKNDLSSQRSVAANSASMLVAFPAADMKSKSKLKEEEEVSTSENNNEVNIEEEEEEEEEEEDEEVEEKVGGPKANNSNQAKKKTLTEPVPMKVDITVGSETLESIGWAKLKMRTNNAGLRVDMDGLDDSNNRKATVDSDDESDSESNESDDHVNAHSIDQKEEVEQEEEQGKGGSQLLEMGKWLYSMIMEDPDWTNNVCDAYVAIDLHIDEDYKASDAILKVHQIVETKLVSSVLDLFCAGVIAIGRNKEGSTDEKQQRGGQASLDGSKDDEKVQHKSVIRIYFFLCPNAQDWLMQQMVQLPFLNELILTKSFVHGNLNIGFDLETLFDCEDQSFCGEALWEGCAQSDSVKQGHEDYKNIQQQRRGAVDLGSRKKQTRRQHQSEETSAEQSAAVEKDKKSDDKKKLSVLGKAMVEQMFNKYDTTRSGSLDVATANRMQSGIGSTVFHSEKAFQDLLREYDVPTDNKGNLTLAGLIHLYTSGQPEHLAEDLWALGLGRYKGTLCYHVQGSIFSLASRNGEGESLLAQHFSSFAEAFALAREQIDLTTMPGVVASQVRALSRVFKVLSRACTHASRGAHSTKVPLFLRKLQGLAVLAKTLCAVPFEHDSSSSMMVCTRDGLLASCALVGLQELFE